MATPESENQRAGQKTKVPLNAVSVSPYRIVVLSSYATMRRWCCS